jgi:hypothetical protein
VLLKEQGWVLVIDQASNAAGVSLWYNGVLKQTTVLLSASPKDPLPKRLQCQVAQLNKFLSTHLPESAVITKIVFEGVRSRLVLVTVGAFLTCDRIHAKISPKTSFVESTSWKRWAQRHGATGPIGDIKGVKALKETGFPVDGIDSDDIADSILIFQTWREFP